MLNRILLLSYSIGIHLYEIVQSALEVHRQSENRSSSMEVSLRCVHLFVLYRLLPLSFSLQAIRKQIFPSACPNDIAYSEINKFF